MDEYKSAGLFLPDAIQWKTVKDKLKKGFNDFQKHVANNFQGDEFPEVKGTYYYYKRTYLLKIKKPDFSNDKKTSYIGRIGNGIVNFAAQENWQASFKTNSVDNYIVYLKKSFNSWNISYEIVLQINLQFQSNQYDGSPQIAINYSVDFKKENIQMDVRYDLMNLISNIENEIRMINDSE